MRKSILLLILLSLSLTTVHFSHAAETAPKATQPALILGIFPRRNAITTLRLFKPLAHYLSEKLQREVTLITEKDFNAFWQAVAAQRYDIVHYNQYHYIVSQQQWGYEVIAKNEEFGDAHIAGALVVRQDSGINTVSDLKGRTIIFGGGPRAMQSYIIARYLLEQAGLQKNDYQTLFSKNPPNALYTTFYKQAAAAGVGDDVISLDIVNKLIDTQQLSILAQGEPLPHLPWAVKADMTPALRDMIQSVLINLKASEAGLEVLGQARLTGLVMTTDAEYDPHRTIISNVYGEDYQID